MGTVHGLAAALLLAASAALADDGRSGLEKGIRQTQEGEYEAAIATLQAAVRQLDAGRDRRQLARAYTYLGVASLNLDREPDAREHFLAALRIDSGLKVTASEFPPRVVSFVEKLRGGGKAAAPAPVATTAPVRYRVDVGSRVRVSAPTALKGMVVGTVSRIDERTVELTTEGSDRPLSLPAAAVTRFDVSQGQGKSPRLRYALVGLAVGAAAGAAYGNGCKFYDDFFEECFEKRGVGKWAGIGAGGGLVLGYLAGSLFGGGEKWTPAERMAIVPSRGGVAVAVRLAF
ncbi:MAG TPA: tetratricopeptide repeat protein [Vicinamibacteria bacterium]|nr:tetratricopeptide repeat protein [Vicinamibacteria bacterium]